MPLPDLSSFEVFKSEGCPFLVEGDRFRIVALSVSAYEVLSRLKNGESQGDIARDLGDGTVNAVLDQLERLKVRGVLQSPHRYTTDRALSTVRGLLGGVCAPIEAILMVAHACNLGCRYCFCGRGGDFPNPGLMTKETAEEILRLFLEAGDGRDFQKIVLFGGEPLLNLPVIQHLVQLWTNWKSRFNGRKLHFVLVTNGTLLDRETVRFLKDHSIAICISVDGPRDIHDANRPAKGGGGSFDRVMSGIALLREKSIPFSVRATVTSQTDLTRLYEFIKTLGADVEYIVPVDYPRQTREEDFQFDTPSYRSFVDGERNLWRAGMHSVKSSSETLASRQLSMSFMNLRERKCGFPLSCMAGLTLLTFDKDGVIYPCQRLAGRREYSIGDLQRGVDKQAVLALYERYIESTRKCDGCWAVRECRRRCMAERADEVSGGFNSIPPSVCDIYRETTRDTVAFALELQSFAKRNGLRLDDVLLRYDTERLMREHSTRTSEL